jgi:hypothetical protein
MRTLKRMQTKGSRKRRRNDEDEERDAKRTERKKKRSKKRSRKTLPRTMELVQNSSISERLVSDPLLLGLIA